MDPDAASAQIDDENVRLMAFRVWSYKMGELVSLLIHLGDRLDLWETLAAAGPVTSSELSRSTGYDERWLREWLDGMAAAELLDRREQVDGSGARFALTPEGVAVLADETDSLFFATGAFAGPVEADVVDGLERAFRTGVGLSYDQLGRSCAHRTERMLGPWARLALVPVILPRLDGVVTNLENGARVADVGCGSGLALLTLAETYPASEFDGWDPSANAIERARANAAERGLTNVSWRRARAEDLPAEPTYDLILTFDCLHDMTRPEEALVAIRRSLVEGGTLLVKEIKCKPTFEENRRNPMLAMLYGFSVSACLSSATSEPGGAGLGTVGLPGERLEAMAGRAGFRSFRTHDVDEPSNLYYELRA